MISFVKMANRPEKSALLLGHLYIGMEAVNAEYAEREEGKAVRFR